MKFIYLIASILLSLTLLVENMRRALQSQMKVILIIVIENWQKHNICPIQYMIRLSNKSTEQNTQLMPLISSPLRTMQTNQNITITASPFHKYSFIHLNLSLSLNLTNLSLRPIKSTKRIKIAKQ